MTWERPNLGAPFGTDGPVLHAILDALGGLHQLLDARLPRGTDAAGGEPARVAEPAPAARPGEAVPVKEPAPVVAPKRDDEKQGGPVKVAEPAPTPPPRAGRGSSEAAWRQFAADVGVELDEDARRDDIIAACVAAGVIPAE